MASDPDNATKQTLWFETMKYKLEIDSLLQTQYEEKEKVFQIRVNELLSHIKEPGKMRGALCDLWQQRRMELEKKIAEREKMLNLCHGPLRFQILREILTLKDRLIELRSGFTITSVEETELFT